jgi:hypothetical protein
MMKVKNTQFMVAMLALSLATVSGYAQTSQPSSKVTAKTANLTLLDYTKGTGGWQKLFSNTIKTANQKDLFISASFEVGLYTQTLVKSKGMVSDTSTADAKVQVRVLLDGTPVEPGAVVYGRRKQTLSATLEGAIAGCLSIDPLTGGIVLDEDCVQPEIIELILETMDAASFNFVAVDVPQGVHTIEVQAQVDTATSAQLGSADAKALVGKGSMTVESVRLIKNPDVILDL